MIASGYLLCFLIGLLIGILLERHRIKRDQL